MQKDELATRKPVSVASAACTTAYWLLVCAHSRRSDRRTRGKPARKANLMGLGRGSCEEMGKGRG